MKASLQAGRGVVKVGASPQDGKSPAVRVQLLIAEPVGDCIGVMTESGDVKLFADPEAVVTWVRRRNASTARRSGAVIVTRIEWRGMPHGFAPPEGTDPR